LRVRDLNLLTEQVAAKIARRFAIAPKEEKTYQFERTY